VFSRASTEKIERWDMVDSIILATARLNECRIITDDEHFRDLRAEVFDQIDGYYESFIFT